MKIFHCVESYYPAIGGMQEVVKQLSERLVVLGHEVIVLTRFHPDRNFDTLNGVKIKTFNVIGNPKAPQTKDDQEYVDFLLHNNSDIITFFAAQQWATDLALPILKLIKSKKVSVPTGYSGLYRPEFKTYFEDMKTYIHEYDMNVYLSDDYRDINFARENKVKNTILIANGAAADEFLPESKIDIRKKLNIPKDDFLILLVGSYTSWKGHKEAVDIFLKSNLKHATLLMIGNNFQFFKRHYVKNPVLYLSKLFNKVFKSKTILFDYISREDTVAAYKASNLFLFPSNIECSPIVLFECAAASLPFLSTDVGNSIEIAEWTKGGKILPTSKDEKGNSYADIEKSAQILNEIYANKIELEQMAKNSHDIWLKKYTWEAITKQYELLYIDLLKK